MVKKEYHEQALVELHAVLQRLQADEKAFQSALNALLERQYADCCAVLDSALERTVQS